MGTITVGGIVISTMDIGEYDRRIELLTAECGRISAFGQGARKPSSNLVSACRVFAAGKFELYQGKSAYSLHSAKISDFFMPLSEDIELTYYGFYFLEVSRYFSRENVEASDMLKLVYVSLKALEKGRIDKKLIRAIFELKMLDINGICPEKDQIVKAQGRFSAGYDLDDSAAYAVEYVLLSSSEKVFTFMLSETAEKQFIQAVNRLMDILVDRRFKSLEFIEML